MPKPIKIEGVKRRLTNAERAALAELPEGATSVRIITAEEARFYARHPHYVVVPIRET